MNPSHTQEAPPPSERGGGRGGRGHQDATRRSQHSWGGQDFDHVVDKMSKSHRGRVRLGDGVLNELFQLKSITPMENITIMSLPML